MLNDRFWTKVLVSDPNDCWEWLAVKNNKGYGMFRPGGLAEKRLAHRLSWEHHNRALKDGECVLHSCDNPGCVNPAHLRVGSMKDNSRDCVERGRHKCVLPGTPPPHYKGEENPMAKMSDAIVKEYRARLANGTVSLRGLARESRLNVKTLSNMRDGKTWKHVL